jgi:predicted house-cleaning noncanonical NTP pyrophosphatase (MazG superfamily)
MPIYNKLIRDLIPERLEGLGIGYRISTLDEEGFRQALREKLAEELKEYLAAAAEDALEELVDLLEVIYALAALSGQDSARLELLRRHKAEERGAFALRLLLLDTDD